MKKLKIFIWRFKLFTAISCTSIHMAHSLDIIEVFSFTCIHCYNVEAQVEQVAKQPKIRISPVPLYDQTNINEVATINAFFAARSLGKEWQFRKAYFTNVFTLGYPAYTPETLKYVLQSINLDNKVFYKLASSQEIIREVNKAVNLAIKYNVSGTPTFIANGHFYEGEYALQEILNYKR